LNKTNIQPAIWLVDPFFLIFGFALNEFLSETVSLWIVLIFVSTFSKLSGGKIQGGHWSRRPALSENFHLSTTIVVVFGFNFHYLFNRAQRFVRWSVVCTNFHSYLLIISFNFIVKLKIGEIWRLLVGFVSILIKLNKNLNW